VKGIKLLNGRPKQIRKAERCKKRGKEDIKL
jgi:hypothetical protein